MTNKLTTSDLLALIGQQVIYQQHQCEIVELLDECVLVLQVLTLAEQDEEPQIQATQHGEGHREVPMTFSLTVFDADGDLHPDFTALALI